jgi:hypothetical protein
MWTTTKPTLPGFYWLCDDGNLTDAYVVRLVEFRDTLMLADSVADYTVEQLGELIVLVHEGDGWEYYTELARLNPEFQWQLVFCTDSLIDNLELMIANLSSQEEKATQHAGMGEEYLESRASLATIESIKELILNMRKIGE